MTTIQEALDAYNRVRENRLALADPEGMLDATMGAWMQAVTDAINGGTGIVKVTTAEDGQVKVEAIAPETVIAEPATIAPTTPSA